MTLMSFAYLSNDTAAASAVRELSYTTSEFITLNTRGRLPSLPVAIWRADIILQNRPMSSCMDQQKRPPEKEGLAALSDFQMEKPANKYSQQEDPHQTTEQKQHHSNKP